jgi:hypothetical protein
MWRASIGHHALACVVISFRRLARTSSDITARRKPPCIAVVDARLFAIAYRIVV